MKLRFVAATLADVIAWAVKETREKFDPERKALRARKISVGKTDKEKHVSSKSAAGINFKPPPTPRPKRVPIPTAIRHEVVREQGVQCTFLSTDNRRCDQRRWLALHHRTPVARGGGNHVHNLTFLCAQHHRAVHAPTR